MIYIYICCIPNSDEWSDIMPQYVNCIMCLHLHTHTSDTVSPKEELVMLKVKVRASMHLVLEETHNTTLFLSHNYALRSHWFSNDFRFLPGTGNWAWELEGTWPMHSWEGLTGPQMFFSLVALRLCAFVLFLNVCPAHCDGHPSSYLGTRRRNTA